MLAKKTNDSSNIFPHSKPSGTIIRQHTDDKSVSRRPKVKFAEAKLPFFSNLRASNPVKTYKSFHAAINRYERYLHEQGLSDPDLEYAFAVQPLEQYKNHLSGTCKLLGQTVRAQFSALKCLWTYTGMRDWLDPDVCPFDQLTMPKKKTPVRERTNEREVLQLFSATLLNNSEREVSINHLLLSTFVHTGVRCEELTNIEIGHIDFERETLEVRYGKGGKSRTLYPPADWFVAARSWCVHRDKMGCKHPYLFASSRTRPISEDHARRRIEQLKAVAGLKGRNGIKPHSLRHFFAKNMHKNGAELETIQQALGHEDLQTTFIYLRSGEENTHEMKRFAAFPAAAAPMTLESPRQAEPRPQAPIAAPQDAHSADAPTAETGLAPTPPAAAPAGPVVAVAVLPQTSAVDGRDPVSAVVRLRHDFGLDTDIGIEPSTPEPSTPEPSTPEPSTPEPSTPEASTGHRVDPIAPLRRSALPPPQPVAGHQRTSLRRQQFANRRYAGRM